MIAAIRRSVALASTTDGVVAIELGLLVPVLAIFVTGVIELGFGLYQAARVYDASEAGMLYAAKYGWNSTGIAAAVVNATGIPGIAATPSPSQFCGCPGTTAVTTVTCSSTCADGSTPSQYIQINASLTRQSIVSFPGLGLPSTLAAQAILRVN
jgi:Flp pilus assembly protein TadG